MLLRQHQSIDALTEVVKTQAYTISAMVPLVKATGSSRSSKASRERRAGAATNGVRGGGGGDRSGATEEADVEAIAEMVAYLDDDVPPSAEAADAAPVSRAYES